MCEGSVHNGYPSIYNSKYAEYAKGKYDSGGQSGRQTYDRTISFVRQSASLF